MAFQREEFRVAQNYIGAKMKPVVADWERFDALRKRYGTVKDNPDISKNLSRRRAYMLYPWPCVQWALFGSKKK